MFPETQKIIVTYLEQGVYPGVSCAFVKPNRTETMTRGFAQISPTKQDLTLSTLFDVASLTKVICTNSLILKLMEEGVINIDQPLQAYLPAFSDPRVTIRHLLTHTSDINPYIKNRDLLSANELRSAILNLVSDDQLGEKVVYTDTGTLLLGFLIEELYQAPVQDLFQAQVLTPLSMNNSGFSPSSKNIAATEIHSVRGPIVGQVHDPKAFVLGAHCGSAGLFTDLTDCLIFVQMMLAGGLAQNGQRFLKDETIDQLFTDHTPSGTLNRSLGWDLIGEASLGRPLLFHTGYTGTFIIIDKKQQEAFVFLSNRVHPVDQRASYVEKRDRIIATYLREKSQSN